MSVLGAGLIGLGASVAIANTLTTRALWTSPMFERSQKVAQTAMMWLVPGLFVVTRHLVRGGSDGVVADPTISREYGAADEAPPFNHDGDYR